MAFPEERLRTKYMTRKNSEEVSYVLSKLAALQDKTLFIRVAAAMSIEKDQKVNRYSYLVNDRHWIVFDAPSWKLTREITDLSYNCFFDKKTGFNLRFGKEIEDDPDFCELGPEILDLEISVNGCVPVKGSENCKYCYKCNTNSPATNMSFETFKKIVNSFPKNLSQIAFGITGLQTNPDLERMLEYCREIGIVPNLTTVGADMNDAMKDILCKHCGAVAVSCYTGAKELCYKTIKELKKHALEKYRRDMHINMHIIFSKDNKEHLLDVLNDISENRVEGLKSVVLLRIKPCGRAKHMDCKIPYSMYEEVVNFCLDKNISFGFDSCSATKVIEVLNNIGKSELCDCCEKCESSKLSSYINVKGEYWSCSFAERTEFMKPVNVLEFESATEWWNSDEVKRIRFYSNPACNSCPIYNLDN